MFKTVLVFRICFVSPFSRGRVYPWESRGASDFVILLLASKEALLFFLSLFYPLLVQVCEAFDYVRIGLSQVFGFCGIMGYIA